MKVLHDPDRGRFLIPTDEGDVYLEYHEKDAETVVFSYVYAPPACRGRGHAAKVLIAAFDWAEERALRVIPTCPYIAHTFLPRFPRYQALVA